MFSTNDVNDPVPTTTALPAAANPASGISKTAGSMRQIDFSILVPPFLNRVSAVVAPASICLKGMGRILSPAYRLII